jgi:hypothetical protein
LSTSPSILVGKPTLIKNNDGSLTCNFTAQFVTIPASVGGVGYNLAAFLRCQSGRIQLNYVNNTTNQLTSNDQAFGIIQGPQQLWTTNQDPPDGTQLMGTVTLPAPFTTPAGSTQQTLSATYVNVELAVQENRVHNAVAQEVEMYVFENVTVP